MSEFLDVIFGRSEKQIEFGESMMHPVSLEEVACNREELKLGGLELEDLVARMKEEVEKWMKESGVAEIGGKDIEVAKL